MKHQDIISKLTLEQKCVLLSGAGEWQSYAFPKAGVQSFWMSDGPNGLRKQEGAGDHLGLNESVKATCFPTAATVANSWDPELGQKVGRALGEEAAAQRVNVLLGPGLNMKRSQLCGRSFEYFSEDPVLAGKMAAGYVRGTQSVGVAACPKHFAVNSQEQRRMASDSIVDERTLREIYLTGFEIVVKESAPKTIMTSYNAVNGEYANESKHLVTDILRKEWGFDGAVITDWGGSNDHVAGVKAGSSLEMPAPGLGPARELLAAIASGSLDEKDVDARVDELIELSMTTHAALKDAPTSFDVEAHHQVAHDAAAQSIVLLKNDDKVLPLAAGIKVALIGDFAEKPRYQGAGSSMVNPTHVDTMKECIAASGLECVGYAQGYTRDGVENPQLIEEAVALAKQADVVLLCVGLAEISESEGLDRDHILMMDNQKALIAAVCEANANTVAVISAGSAIETGWTKSCKAVVHGYLGGQAGAGAMMDVITGKVCPSGKLSETLPVKYEDTPAYNYFPGLNRNVEYREGLYIGYRYYDTAGVPVAYPFGFGLSYTTFAYSDVKAEAGKVTFTLTNTGSVDGAEIAQVYVGKKDAKIFRPAKELKGFAKVFLKAGESKSVTVTLDDKAYRYFNTKTNKWEIEGGTYQVMVGANVADIKLSADVVVKGTGAANPYAGMELPSYSTGKIQNVSDAEFAAVYGRPVPQEPKGINRNSAFRDLNHSRSPIFWLVWAIMTNIYKSSMAKGKPDLNVLFIYNMPLRGLAKMTGGAVSMEMVDGLVMECKGFWLIGLIRTLIGLVQKSIADAKLAAKLKAAE